MKVECDGEREELAVRVEHRLRERKGGVEQLVELILRLG